jgi:hypothetical protein
MICVAGIAELDSVNILIISTTTKSTIILSEK